MQLAPWIEFKVSETHTLTRNISWTLRMRSHEHPHTLAVLAPAGRDRFGRWRHTHWTYRQLEQESDWIAEGLRLAGLAPGVRVALMVPPSHEFFSVTFALFKLGAAPVFIDPGMGPRHLGRCLDEAQPEVFIGGLKAHLARVILGWARRTLRLRIAVGNWSRLPGMIDLERIRQAGEHASLTSPSRFPYPIHETGEFEVAAVLFTSGSTGVPKGAVYTHSIFQAQVEMLRAQYGIQPGEIDLCTFPLFALFAPGLGMTSVVPSMNPTRPAWVDPDTIRAAIDDFGVTNLFGSPALLKRVAIDALDHGWKFPSLRRVVSAGAPVAPRVLEWFSRILQPDALIHTPYGATESLPVCSIDHKTVLRETRSRTDAGGGVCVGYPVADMEVRVIRVTDDPIATWSDELQVPTGTIGEIVVKGPVVTRSYWNRPRSTELAKILDVQSGAILHRMGDVGYLDDLGRLWFCGRKSHRVITSDTILYTIPCEAIFNTHPEVARTALVAVEREGRTLPVLCVEPLRKLRKPEQDRLRGDLLSLGATCEQTRQIQTILFHPSFPVDIRHNAKIFREKLAAWSTREIARS